MENKYNGYKELVLTNEQFSEMYTNGRIGDYLFKENEYLIAKNEEGEVVDKLQQKHGRLKRVPFQTLKNAYLGEIKPRNDQQELTVDLLLDLTLKLK